MRSAAGTDLALMLAKGAGLAPGLPAGGSDLAQLGLVVGAAYLLHELVGVITVLFRGIRKTVRRRRVR